MPCSNKPLSRSRAHRRGAALVEFAISFAVMWFLFAGVFGFGSAFYTYNRLQTAVAGAAKLGAKLDYDTSNPAAFSTSLKNMVMYGDTVAGNHPIVPGLSASDVQVNVGNDANSIPRDISVSINGYTIDALFYRITLTGRPRAVMFYTGRMACSGC